MPDLDGHGRPAAGRRVLDRPRPRLRARPLDTGRATITIHDTEGLLDPTNTGGAYYGDIQPLKQARLALWNPVLEDWYTRFRGFVESLRVRLRPLAAREPVTISLVDIFEIVSAVQMFPGYFGDPPPAASRRARSSSSRTRSTTTSTGCRTASWTS